MMLRRWRWFFFFNDTATTEIYTLSLHDALPIFIGWQGALLYVLGEGGTRNITDEDRKSTRLNSSHGSISYAVFCLIKKNTQVINWSPAQPMLLLACTLARPDHSRH